MQRVVAGAFAAQPVRAEQAVGIAAETGRDAVDRLLPGDLGGEEVGGSLHATELGLVEHHAGTPRHRHDLGAGEGATVEMDRGSAGHLNAPPVRAAGPVRP
jgi:hypothetical protein